MSVHISLPEDKIARFCSKWRITELALFGSVLRDDFGPESDVDVLVSFAPDADHLLFYLAGMQDELQTLLGREVDLVERAAVETARNYLRRKAILDSAERVYAA